MWRVVVMGVSGCGKSTFGAALAQAAGAVFLDADDLHPPENIARMAQGAPLSDADRWPWLALCATAMARESRVVLACSALRRSYRDHLRAGVPGLRFVHMAADKATIAERLAQRRGHFMPPALLDSQFATLEAPDAAEALILPAFAPLEPAVRQALVALG